MRRVAQLVWVSLLATGCGSGSRDLTSEEVALLEQLGLDAPEVIAAIQAAGGPVDRLVGIDEGGSPLPAAGVTIRVPRGRVEGTISELRDRIGGLGFGVYHSEQNFGLEADRIAVLGSPDPYEFLRLVRTDGINWDLEHEDVVQRLRAWDARYRLDFAGAGLDWVSARFEDPPNDMDAFAAEVYAFCPDVVDQGVGTVAALAREMRTSGSLYCWWD